ncbi:murein DD-endopeptidase MepM/ murein hydrolase activator NlpD [Kitasatospora gansuensis]|uniref:Murein DD-endopeptidase MepM/ murein hydrolase activator NlpD n=1 Tax=Kitasatospora gansuensis TaxID=258050 RepID=A0A7W7WH18_9ACTN|nr:M23 family metallopeptidase [Kitasatospora gansuensis]MBB4946678.1 murein DD-endopeptidase MepM/ murein hydrolase activator NlpD [Kitasatospora gansuensis]
MGTPLFPLSLPLPAVAPALSAGPNAGPPPHPPDRRVVVLLVALLTALLLVGLPQPPASGARGLHGVAGPPGAPVVGPGPGRAWPVGGPGGLLQRFDPPPERWAAGHRGVDLAASVGATVRAAAPGVVSFTGMVAGRPVVTVTHPASGNPPLRTTYLPVTGSLPVGTAVAGGEPIGVLATGVGHCATGCLHWGLLRGKRYLDPLALLGTGQARLLPLDGG